VVDDVGDQFGHQQRGVPPTIGFPVADSTAPAAGDAAARALEGLVIELDACIGELQQARTRSEELLEQRQ
jgi:hypothetical protein